MISSTTKAEFELTEAKLMETIRKISAVPNEYLNPNQKKKSCFERLMNRFGWIRQSEVIVVDKSALERFVYSWRLYP